MPGTGSAVAEGKAPSGETVGVAAAEGVMDADAPNVMLAVAVLDVEAVPVGDSVDVGSGLAVEKAVSVALLLPVPRDLRSYGT